MAHSLGASISRVTDKPRNSANMASKTEVAIIRKYKAQVAAAVNTKPTSLNEAGRQLFYFPIQTNALCLQCHGNSATQINKETLNRLKALYPQDQATGYGLNEVRGLWKVELKKAQLK